MKKNVFIESTFKSADDVTSGTVGKFGCNSND